MANVINSTTENLNTKKIIILFVKSETNYLISYESIKGFIMHEHERYKDIQIRLNMTHLFPS